MADGTSFPSPVKITLDENDPISVLEMLKQHLLQPRGLIGMPTETVYGLAANGFCEDSVRHIFTVKGRPLTDPVILHVPSFVDALESIFDTSLFDAFVVLLMASRFSPGPITIITRGKSSIPAVVSANTMFPAVRCPSHPVAQMLLKHVGVPLAAPSANKFGHISPTRADHVMSEFVDTPLLVLDAGECHLGVESTVVKVEPSDEGVNANEFLHEHTATYGTLAAIVAAIEPGMLGNPSALAPFVDRLSATGVAPPDLARAFLGHINKFKDRPRRITILRRGFVTEGDLRLLFNQSVFPRTEVVCRGMFSSVKDVCEAPGSMLTHYAPSAPTYLLGESKKPCGIVVTPDRIVMIDAKGEFKDSADCFLHYFPLDQDDEVVAHELYARLRDAEAVALRYNRAAQCSADAPDFLNKSAIIVVNHAKCESDLNATVRDRLLRACSGKTICYDSASGNIAFLL